MATFAPCHQLVNDALFLELGDLLKAHAQELAKNVLVMLAQERVGTLH